MKHGYLKTNHEIEIMREGGKRLRKAMDELVPKITVGITTSEIDSEAERLIVAQGGLPSFKTVKGYSWSTCLPVNEETVHTPPSKRKLVDGDLLTVDIGMLYQGLHTDFAISFVVGKSTDKKVEDFLETGKIALKKGIEQAKVGNRIGHISKAIYDTVYKPGYFILKELTGHGIGKELHEDPYVLNYLDRPIEKTMQIRPGLVVAIEVIYSLGTEEIAYEKEGDWSIITADRSLSACFEHTVAITEENTHILT